MTKSLLSDGLNGSSSQSDPTLASTVPSSVPLLIVLFDKVFGIKFGSFVPDLLSSSSEVYVSLFVGVVLKALDS